MSELFNKFLKDKKEKTISTVPIGLRIPKDLYMAIDELSKKNKMSKTEVVVGMIEFALDANKGQKR